MRLQQVVAVVLVSAVVGSAAMPPRASGQVPPGMPPPPGVQPLPPPGTDIPDPDAVTPPRVSYLYGGVAFWRPGAPDWGAAQLNTALAPGDVLYAEPGANVEIQVGPLAFVRAADGAQLGLDNQETDFLQLRITSGHAALDLRQLPPGLTVELDTPGAAFSMARAGYYRVDADPTATVLAVHGGGSAVMSLPGSGPIMVTDGQQVIVSAGDPPALGFATAPALTAWDEWNRQRTEQALQAMGGPYVSPGVYGTEMLVQYGRWQTVPAYGPVWVPVGVPPGWVPYSTGRWLWDPRFGWTWLDDAPWGWAPYHYGRWVYLDGYWAWAPGPVVVRPVYAPALVVFVGALDVAGHRPVCWAPLGWGEPVIPWWGPRGYVGVPHWAGWGGPRVVNNVVIDRHVTVSATNVTVYRNVQVAGAVVGIPTDQFGHGRIRAQRIDPQRLREVRPIRAPEIGPVAASLVPATGAAVRPPRSVVTRPVVATRPGKDWTPVLRNHGLAVGPDAPVATRRIVTPPVHRGASGVLESPPQSSPAVPSGPRPSPAGPRSWSPDPRPPSVPPARVFATFAGPKAGPTADGIPPRGHDATGPGGGGEGHPAYRAPVAVTAPPPRPVPGAPPSVLTPEAQGAGGPHGNAPLLGLPSGRAAVPRSAASDALASPRPGADPRRATVHPGPGLDAIRSATPREGVSGHAGPPGRRDTGGQVLRIGPAPVPPAAIPVKPPVAPNGRALPIAPVPGPS
jgi:hypothetical protein